MAGLINCKYQIKNLIKTGISIKIQMKMKKPKNCKTILMQVLMKLQKIMLTTYNKMNKKNPMI